MIQLIEIREPQIEYENGIRRRAGTRNHDSIDSEYLKIVPVLIRLIGKFLGVLNLVFTEDDESPLSRTVLVHVNLLVRVSVAVQMRSQDRIILESDENF